MYNQTILRCEVIGFALKLFANNRSGGIFKRINSKEYDTVIREAKNATWDLVQITLFVECHRNRAPGTIYSFVTRDENLLNLSDSILDLYNDNDAFKASVNSLYPNFGYEEFKKRIEMFGRRPDKDNHIKKVLSSLDETIQGLENQVRDRLSIKRN
ncbi:MAG: hypothetical protein PF904_17365 [Kiritimatiellae bacterium]|jgi:hypothetical protein|nr:hypothetical protein [Kiritimatiellia bacterium]